MCRNGGRTEAAIDAAVCGYRQLRLQRGSEMRMEKASVGLLPVGSHSDQDEVEFVVPHSGALAGLCLHRSDLT